jgi:hypothetical protein
MGAKAACKAMMYQLLLKNLIDGKPTDFSCVVCGNKTD